MRRVALVVTCAALVALAACSSETRDPGESLIVSTMARADESVIRTRPRLVAGKYARMARGRLGGRAELFAHSERRSPGPVQDRKGHSRRAERGVTTSVIGTDRIGGSSA
jgi:hypothetical protein